MFELFQSVKTPPKSIVRLFSLFGRQPKLPTVMLHMQREFIKEAVASLYTVDNPEENQQSIIVVSRVTLRDKDRLKLLLQNNNVSKEDSDKYEQMFDQARHGCEYIIVTKD